MSSLSDTWLYLFSTRLELPENQLITLLFGCIDFWSAHPFPFVCVCAELRKKQFNCKHTARCLGLRGFRHVESAADTIFFVSIISQVMPTYN